MPTRAFPRPRARRSPGRRAIPVLAAAALLAACTTSSPTAHPAAASQGPYVALGDSYTAGPEIPDQTGTPAGCQRSDHSYPYLLARRLKLSGTGFRDVSCSGATIADLTAPQDTGGGTNPAQLDALSAQTATVTLGIGGNDLDFAGVLTRCVELDAPATLVATLRHATSDPAPCRASYTIGGTDQIAHKAEVAAARLGDALAEIRTRAPHARVYVVGYPALLPAGGRSCAEETGLTPGDVAFVTAEELNLDAMLRQQAQAAGDTYVDTYTPSVGHDACSDPATRWIEPVIAEDAAPLHPNALGEQEIAEILERAVTGAAAP